ncbi:sugar phosphate isomerase/epimerase [Verrucomicrobiales bacterium]|nr:sugar phosphate isomerase/epimerase [Verrucomicrobiales bacterium]
MDFRKDEETFKNGLAELPKQAAGLKRAGLKRIGTWLMPCDDELTYLANFKQHADRLREVAKVLGDSGLMLGFEYVGTASLMASKKFPFLHTMAETRELNAAIGTDNVGLVLDSWHWWHWWQAGDSAEAIRELKSEEIALVDLNDAPKGVKKNAQEDGKRELPMATGVIDVKPFLESLVAIGYDGPVRAEPFNQALRDLEDDAACAATSAAIDKGFALVGG